MCVCACVCVCMSVCVWCARNVINYNYIYFFRLTCIFVSLTDFVKRSVIILVDEMPRYRNYHYYYYYYDDYLGTEYNLQSNSSGWFCTILERLHNVTKFCCMIILPWCHSGADRSEHVLRILTNDVDLSRPGHMM